MRVPTRLAVSVAAVAAGASLITAAPAMADDTTALGTTSEVATTQELALPAAPTGLVAPAAVAPAAESVVAVTPQATYLDAVWAAVAAKMRYEAAIRAAVIAKWRQDAYWAAVRAAVAAKMRSAAAASYGSGVGYAAMQNALSRVGAAYTWGGQGPWAFDCSGLVAWAFRSAGYNLPGGSSNQIGYGYYVNYYSLQPGDLVFYGPGGSQHVAIYIGNGNVVQASNYNTGVHIASIWYIGSPTAYKRL